MSHEAQRPDLPEIRHHIFIGEVMGKLGVPEPKRVWGKGTSAQEAWNEVRGTLPAGFNLRAVYLRVCQPKHKGEAVIVSTEVELPRF